MLVHVRHHLKQRRARFLCLILGHDWYAPAFKPTMDVLWCARCLVLRPVESHTIKAKRFDHVQEQGKEAIGEWLEKSGVGR